MPIQNNSLDSAAESTQQRAIQQQVTDAFSTKTPLRIIAGNSKAFFGNTFFDKESNSAIKHEKLDISTYQGIIEYQPSELVVTVRSGTLLHELEAELKANHQMLAFEPPQHSANTTIGGIIACGLSGPGRAAYGSARDFVLGTTIINGKAEKLKFGGQVMKNVAGYDASRLMVGAQGTLGVLLDISLKVLPVVESEVTLSMTVELKTAIDQLRQWIKQGLPVTASCFLNDTLYIRLGSTASAVRQTLITINKKFDTKEIHTNFWATIKNQTHDFFTSKLSANKIQKNTQSDSLWRCSHQSTTEFYSDTKSQLIEWNGALRWLYCNENLHLLAAKHGGHATRYPIISDQQPLDIFQPLQPAMLKIHQRLKRAFDPENILNPGRLYPDL